MADIRQPGTWSEIEQALSGDANRKSYIYVGQDEDAGWKVARRVANAVSGVVVLLVSNASLLKEGGVQTDHPGVVFGYGTDVSKYLEKPETESMAKVSRAIADAQ